MLHCGREVDLDAALGVVDVDVVHVDDVQLLESVGVLGVDDVPDVFEYLPVVDGFPRVVFGLPARREGARGGCGAALVDSGCRVVGEALHSSSEFEIRSRVLCVRRAPRALLLCSALYVRGLDSWVEGATG